MASPEERIFDTLAALRDSTDSVREYLAKAAELRAGADIPDRNGAEAKLSAALAKVEAGLGGKPLLFSDEKGMTAFENEASHWSRDALVQHFPSLPRTRAEAHAALFPTPPQLKAIGSAVGAAGSVDAAWAESQKQEVRRAPASESSRTLYVCMSTNVTAWIRNQA